MKTPADYGFAHGYDVERHPRLRYPVTDPVMGIGALTQADLISASMGVMLQGRIAAEYIAHLQRRVDELERERQATPALGQPQG